MTDLLIFPEEFHPGRAEEQLIRQLKLAFSGSHSEER